MPDTPARTAATGATASEPLAAQYFRIRYERDAGTDRASGPVSTSLSAYSAADAEARVRSEMRFYDITVLDVLALDEPEPVTCTYNGGEGAIHPDGPWVFLDYTDYWAPHLVCDIHGEPAHDCVYDSSDLRDENPAPYSGPCRRFPEPFTDPA